MGGRTKAEAGAGPPDWTEGCKRLSSAWTPVARYGFPAVWITGFAIGTLLTLARTLRQAPANPFALPLILAAIWLGGSAALVAYARMLKTAVLEGDDLVVGGFRHTERIPLSAVADVAVPGWSMDLVRVSLKEPGRWGTRFYFLARVVATWHPVTALQSARLLQASLPPGEPGRPAP